MGGEWDIVIIKCLMYHHNMQQEPDGIHTRNQAFEATQLTLKLIQEGRNCGDFLSLVSHNIAENFKPENFQFILKFLLHFLENQSLTPLKTIAKFKKKKIRKAK
jgi:hypothetical protein